MFRRCCIAIVLGLLVLTGSPVEAGKWSRAYIRELPDSAFAAIETAPDGKSVRHLPHHDAAGRLDLPHLQSALARLHQVKWQDPGTAGSARQHLLDHWRQHQRDHGSLPLRKTP